MTEVEAVRIRELETAQKKAEDLFHEIEKRGLIRAGIRESQFKRGNLFSGETDVWVSFANNRSEQKWLCCNAFISVMKATELWNCDNLSNLQRLSRERTLLGEA
jgi:hypothetical protein